MSKRIFLLAALLGASVLFGDAIAIGHSRNGYPLIVPQPQSLKTQAGNFALPAKLAVAAPEKFDLAPLAKVYAATVKGGKVVPAGKGAAACRFEVVTEGVPKSVEGYALAVTPKGIAVKARDVRGLYYGMQTLGWILRNRADAGAIPCAAISDYPDLKIRGLFYQLGGVTPAEVGRVCHVIDALGSLKYNTLLLSLGSNFPFEDSPFTGRKTTLSRADVEKIVAAAKRNHMEIIPYLQLISHANWMTAHKDWEKLREGKSNTFCLSNPELQPLTEKVVREVADFFKPRYFHIGLDEIEQCGFPKCEQCKAINLKEKMLEHLLPVKKILNDRGITPVIYQDQFFGFGEPKILKGLGITDFPEAFGKDTVIESWEYAPRPTAQIANRIKSRGFKNFHYMSFVLSTENAQNLPKVAYRAGAGGTIAAYWSMMTPLFNRPDLGRYPFYPGFLAQANYSWNAKDADLVQLPFDSAVIFQEALDGAPAWTFRGAATPLPLDGVLNRAIAADPVFPALDEATLAKVKAIAAADSAKFDLKVRNGAPLAVVLSGCKDDGFAAGPVRIPVGTTATGASFLVQAAFFNMLATPWGWGFIARDIPAGQLEVRYAEGGAAKIPLTVRRTFNDWNTYLGGNLCRTVARGNDRNGALVSFYAIDWRNPNPEKEIREIVFSAKAGTQIAPILYAVSLSDAGAAPKGAAGEMKIAAPAQRAVPKMTPMVDFAKGLHARTKPTDKGISGFTYKVVADSKYGKVLEMKMPKIDKFLARGAVDLPISAPPAYESIVFDVRVDGYRAVYRPDFYMLRGGLDAGRAFAEELGPRWQRVCIPKSLLFAKTTKLKPEDARSIRFGFFMLDGNGPCTIRVARVGYLDGVIPYRANVTTPVVPAKTAK